MKLTSMILSSAVVLVSANAAAAVPLDNYVGIGASTDFDETNVLVNSKFKLGDLNEQLSVSARPGVEVRDSNLGINLPLTVEGTIKERIHPYVGGGIQVNTEDQVNALVTGGVDINTTPNTVLNLGVNYVPDSEYGNEVSAQVALGYRF